MKLRDYQKETKNKLLKILNNEGVVYLAGEVRTGKTVIALRLADDYLPEGSDEILFITSKKAIPDIEEQIIDSGVELNIKLINFESVHKIPKKKKFDFLIIDEAHRLGMFPKPGKIAKLIHKRFKWLPTILMSGTPSPESYCQLFHQFWVTGQGPWKKFINFYKWANKYVDKETIYIGMGHNPIDYSHAKPKVLKEFKSYRVSMTQKQAGFNGKVIEQIHTVKIPDKIAFQLSILSKTKLLEKPELVADTAAKLKMYFHQMASGTVIDIGGKQWTLSDFKIQFIKQKFKNKKLAIYYVYRKEGDLLKKEFPEWTSDPKEFTEKKTSIFICQIQSGREGINLQKADCILFYNISYSAVSYLQARARGQSLTSGDCFIHWIFSSTGIEQAIYEIVKQKEDFTTKHFSDYVRNLHPKKNKKVAQAKRMDSNKTTSDRSSKLSRPYSVKRKKSSLVYRSKKARRKTNSTTRTKYRVT